MSGNAEMAAAWDGPEGDHWADHADRYEATSERYAAALFAQLDVGEDAAVLDVGCGNGRSTLEAGRRASSGSALGVDLSSRMLEGARAAAAAEGLEQVTFEQADAQVHPFAPAAYDVGISLFGAMFFADPVEAFANIRRALRPNATFTTLAWRELPRNEWIDAVRIALAAGRDLPTPLPGTQGPFSLADRAIAADWFAAAGYATVDFVSIDEPVCFGRDAADAYSFVSTVGITRGLPADLDDATRKDALGRLRRTLEDHETPDGVQFGASAWLITATNA